MWCIVHLSQSLAWWVGESPITHGGDLDTCSHETPGAGYPHPHVEPTHTPTIHTPTTIRKPHKFKLFVDKNMPTIVSAC